MPTIDHEPSQPPIERNSGRWKVVVQIACVAVTALVLFALRNAFYATADIFGPGFGWGVTFGILFAFAMYGIICWIDPSSRPRGTSTKD